MHAAAFAFLEDASTARRLVAAGVRLQDCDERFILGSGPGGQKINKTASTVSLRHHPSAIEIRVQAERSRSRNRELAWAQLATRLETLAAEKASAARAAKELQRRRSRQKSPAQKARMLQSKTHRARTKSTRSRPRSDD